MINYAQMKVNQIRQELVDSGLYDEGSIYSTTGKSNLVKMHKAMLEQRENLNIEEEVPFDEEEEILEELTSATIKANATINENETDDQEEKQITYGGEEWSQYVMNQFQPGELDPKGNPRINGLRRVTNNLLGPIVFSGPVEIQANLEPESIGRACVIGEVRIAWADNHNDIRVFRDAGGSWVGNTSDEFAIYPEAMAATRAESRALRKALCIDKVSADEISDKDASEVVQQYTNKNVDEEWGSDGPISQTQQRAIQTLCERLNIDVVKFINSGNDTYENINDVNRLTAAKMLERLNQYQNASAIEIPEEIKLEKE